VIRKKKPWMLIEYIKYHGIYINFKWNKLMLELHVFWRVRNEKEKNNKYDNWSNKKMKKGYKI